MAAISLDLDDALLAAAREGARIALAEHEAREGEALSPWLNVEGAADYLVTTEDAIRSLAKRREIPFEKAPNGRLLFNRHELDGWVRGEWTPQERPGLALAA